MLNFIILYLLLINPQSDGGQMVTTEGYVRFYSEAPLENIEAVNNHVKAAVDLSNGELLLIVPIKEFVFKKSLMQRHFNQNFMESDKFPEARFEGKIANFGEIGETTMSSHEITGRLTIHGVTKTINEIAYLQHHGQFLAGNSKFYVRTNDFDIRIPNILIRNIAEVIEVNVHVKLYPAKNEK